MTYSEAIQFLYELRLFGAKFGLENTFKLAALAGNPQRNLRFIHVAGTNGKGSTCAMIESIYRAAGFKVGLFTSPHLVAFGERIQINRQPIPESEVVRLITEMRQLLDHPIWSAPDPAVPAPMTLPLRRPPPGAVLASQHPTFFEVVTVMALRYFARHQCDLVIWETGLGGRFDATNIVTPLASVITNVQFDHQQWLGDTLAQIAFEKAGIIKPGRPALTATDVPEALDVIVREAGRRPAPLTVVTRADTRQPPLAGLVLPLRGEHQRLNAALALATIRILEPELPVPATAPSAGLAAVCWPGRLQVEQTASGQTLVFDGAHNPAGAGTLRAGIRYYFPDQKPTLVLGILRDKDWVTMCRILAPLARRLLLVPVHSQRTAAPEVLHAVCRDANHSVELIDCASLAEALDLAQADPLVVVTGSLYLVGEALARLKLVPAAPDNERALNEWSPANSLTLTRQT